MLIYTGDTGTRSRIKEIKRYGLGVLLTPKDRIGRKHHNDIPIALDNGAWSSYVSGGREPNLPSFIKLVQAAVKSDIRVRFAVAPDIVGGGKESLELSIFWASPGTMLYDKVPFYLAVQDGMTPKDIEEYLRMFKGLFVGGTMDWKLLTAPMWVKYAHAHGMKCHVARCGTIERMAWAQSISADSIDSTSIVRNDWFWKIDSFLNPKQLDLFKAVDKF